MEMFVFYQSKNNPQTSILPSPIPDLRHILAILSDVLLVFDQAVADVLFDVGGLWSQAFYAVDYVGDEVEAVEVVHHHHVEWRRRGALLFVAAHMQVLMVGAAVGQAVDQPRVAVVGEDDRLVGGEEVVEVAI